MFRRCLFSGIWSSAQDHAVLVLLLNLVGFVISTRPRWSGRNVLYHSCSSFEGASRGGQPLNIFTWFIGAGGLETERTSSPHVNITADIQLRGNFEIKRHFPKTLWPRTGFQKMVRLINHNLNQRVGSWEKNERKTEEGLEGNYSWDARSSWTNYRSLPQ